MCDVMVGLPDATSNGRTIFAKNSDRPSGECQVLYRDPGGSHAASERAGCSYCAVPRGPHTLSTLGLRPYWCWGYETGVNEAGVAGGNAAIFTNTSADADAARQPGLTGMDILRLSLERGESAEQCVGEACTLLERYGQWGSAVRGKNHEEGSYDNSFLFADAGEAWVLETAGRRWAARRITSGTCSISNELTIRTSFDRSAGLRADGTEDGTIDFAEVYEDHTGYARQVSHIRRMRTASLLAAREGRVTVETMMGILRDHFEDTFLGGPSFHRYLPDFQTVCMHESPAGFTWGDTATALAVEIDPSLSQPIWVCYLPPCSSVFLPLFFDSPLDERLTSPGSAGLNVARPATASADTFRSDSLWWRLHRLVKATAAQPYRRYPRLREYFDTVEHARLESVAVGGPGKDRSGASGGRPVDRQFKNRITKEAVDRLFEAIESLEQEWGIE